MAHEGSVHNSERRAIEAAEARGEERGYAAGWSDRGEADIDFMVRSGELSAASKLRNARVVDRDEGNVVDLTKGAERG
jgi:hypothetical protein